MRFIVISSLLLLVASAKELLGYVELDVFRSPVSKHPNYRDFLKVDTLEKREEIGPVHVSLLNDLYFYHLTLKIGTPPQEVRVVIDTGSQETWISDPNNRYCDTNRKVNDTGPVVNCTEYGTYDYSKSSTYISLNITYEKLYGNGTFVNGHWALDNIELGTIFLPQSSFVIAENATASTGVLGLGTYTSESGGADSLIVKLYTILNFIKSPVYSLWLNGLDEQSGQLLIGAMDTAKYDGKLYTVPMVNSNPGVLPIVYPFELCIELSGLALSDTNGVVEYVMEGSLYAFLDSGTGFTYLPPLLLEVIAQSIGAKPTGDGYYTVDCRVRNGDTAIVLNFNGAIIKVPLAQLLLEMSDTCLLLIRPSSDETRTILGTSFLRSIYLIVDIASQEVSVAQAKFNVTTSNVVEIVKSRLLRDSYILLPGAVLAPQYSYFSRYFSSISNTTHVAFEPIMVRNITGNFSGNSPPSVSGVSK